MSLRSAVRSRVRRHAPPLDGAAAQERWRASNAARALQAPPPLSAPAAEVHERLRRDGIAITRFDELFGSTALFDEASAEARALYEAHVARPPVAEAGRKPFLHQLAIVEDLASPFARIALHAAPLGIANGYLGMRSLLRTVQVWLTVPTEGPALETQLWHRDADDLMNVKVFVWFTDVTREAGPFTYAPRTHPIGDRRQLPERDDQGRSTDAQMEAVVPAADWIVSTGGPGTVVLADTCGYHKQLKPRSAERLALVVQYTSGTPAAPRTVSFHGAGDLTPDQRAAVEA